MVTEANWKTWRKDDFVPYLDAVVSAFGIDRIMFGSDWPVCLVAASYPDMIGIVDDYFFASSDVEKSKVFGGNAAKFYHL
jgi:L-fuconolactonase